MAEVSPRSPPGGGLLPLIEGMDGPVTEATLLLALPLVLYVGPRLSLQLVLGSSPLAIQVAVVAFWSALLVVVMAQAANEDASRANWRRGSRIYRPLRWPFATVLAVLAAVLALAWTDFSALTCVLREVGWAKIQPDFPADECLPRLQDFYLWQFVNAIPGFAVPETLRWDMPYTYSDSATGAVVLGYKLGILVPFFSALRLWRRLVREERDRADRATVAPRFDNASPSVRSEDPAAASQSAKGR